MKQEPRFLARENLQILLNLLSAAGFECIGPQVRNDAIIFAPITDINQLPQGIIELQSPGTYTLRHTDSPAWFLWATGPQAIKPYLFAAHEMLWSVRKKTDGSLQFHENEPDQKKLPTLNALPAQIDASNNAIDTARKQQRQLPSENLRDVLFDNLDHPHWQNIAERCLSCGNCTAVCPTCFCHSEADITALDGQQSKHVREWDSCFTPNHSYIHGITIREQTAHRYRQWLTHKLGSWHDQYGRSGCVGCGRCITWCPVGIDITAEIAAISGESS